MPQHLDIAPVRLAVRARRLLASCLLLTSMGGCAEINWPFHHHEQPPPPPSSNGKQSDEAAACADLLSQIRQSEQERRAAITTSTDPDIVGAAQGKADQRIEVLRQRYDDLDCPSSDLRDTTRRHREPPLQPAPGSAPNP